MVDYYRKPVLYQKELCYLVSNLDTNRYEVVCPWVLKTIAEMPATPEGLAVGKAKVDEFVEWVHREFGGNK